MSHRLLCFLCTLTLSVSSLQAEESNTTPETAVSFPQPLELEGDWWAYFEVSPEKMPGAIKAFKKYLDEVLAGLSQEEHEAIFAKVDDVILNLKLWHKKKNEPVPTSPPQLQFRKQYTLTQILEINQRLLEVKNEIVQLKERKESQKERLARIQSEWDARFFDYQTLSVSSYERLHTGLGIIEKRAEHALYTAELDNLNKRLQYYEHKKHLLRDELQHSRTKLTLENLAQETLTENLMKSNHLLRGALKRLDALEKESLNKGEEELQSEFLCCQWDYQLMTQAIRIEYLRMAALLDEIQLTYFDIVQSANGVDDTKIREQFGHWDELIQQAEDAVRQWQKHLDTAYAKVSSVIAKMLKDDEERTEQQAAVIDDIHFELDQSFALLKNLKVTIKHAELLYGFVESHFLEERPLTETWVITAKSYWQAVEESFVQTTMVTLFYVNERPVTIGLLLKAILAVVGAILFSKYLRKGLSKRLVLSRTLSTSTRYIILRLTHYAIVIIGFLFALSVIGLDFTNLAIIAGALGVGIGFGLQSMVNNILSGFMLLLNRYLKVGDIIEWEGKGFATVKGINLQNTHISTFDGADVIIPNALLSTQAFTNWTMQNCYRRYRIPFGVAYGTDKDELRKVVLEAVKEEPYVLVGKYPYPEPEIWFASYGDSAVNFELVVWVDLNIPTPHGIASSSLLWVVDNVLTEHRISIPFPQRDLHIKDVAKLS